MTQACSATQMTQASYQTIAPVSGDCVGTIGTAGSLGTVGGTAGSAATAGTYGCSLHQQMMRASAPAPVSSTRLSGRHTG